MKNESSRPALKRNGIILLISILLISLSCNSPDVWGMVVDELNAPEDTEEAKKDLKRFEEETMAARVNETSTQAAKEKTRQAQLTNEQATLNWYSEMTSIDINKTSEVLQQTQARLTYDQRLNEWSSTMWSKDRTQTAEVAEKTKRVEDAANTNAVKSYEETKATEPRAPAIDSIRFPREITTDVTAEGFIDFHDANGDVNRVTITAIQAERFSPGGYDPPYSLVSGDEKKGTYRFTFTCGYSQFLKLKITLYDATGLSSPGIVFATTCKP